MKKLMILGASDLQLPAILECKRLGICSCVLDYNDSAIGKEFADIFYQVSTLDKDEIKKVAINENVDGIITLASDKPIPIIAEIAEELGLISISKEAAIKSTNKAQMRIALKESGVPIPEFFVVKTKSQYKEACSNFNDKFITKPADNSGSRGIYLVEDIKCSEIAYEHSMKNSVEKCILVEEYMEGPEVSVETFTINGEVSVIAITDKITTGAPFFVEMGHSQPSQHKQSVKCEIREIAIQGVKSLGITNGPSHVEIKITKDGPKIVEIGARLGGDCITTHLTPLSTGIDLVALTILNAIGKHVEINNPKNDCAIIRYLISREGKIMNIETKKLNDSNIVEVFFTKKIGDIVSEVKCSNDRIGYIIVKGKELSEAEIAYKKMLEQISITIEEMSI